MSGDEYGEFENRLRRGRLAGPAAVLKARVLSATTASPASVAGRDSQTSKAPWFTLLAAGVAVAASAAINARIDRGARLAAPPTQPVAITVQPAVPGSTPVIVFQPSRTPPVSIETIIKQRKQLEALLGS